MTDDVTKELEELRQQRTEIADLKRRICDELYNYPAYALLETLISLQKSAITPEEAAGEFICNLKGAENASNAH